MPSFFNTSLRVFVHPSARFFVVTAGAGPCQAVPYVLAEFKKGNSYLFCSLLRESRLQFRPLSIQS